MTKRPLPIVEATLEKIVGGGQALGEMPDGRKLFVWGGLPGEKVSVQLTKKKSSYAEGVVVDVIIPSPDRITPKDPTSYLSTSPWQIMNFDAEQRHKAALIEEAFELHKVFLPKPVEVYSNGVEYGYRNKIEFSFWFDTDTQKLSLAFFKRGSHGKQVIDGTSLALPQINQKAQEVISALNSLSVIGRQLKTLLIRCSQNGLVAWQLYVKDENFPVKKFMALFEASENGEVIYSNPKSPASVITKRLTNESTPLNDVLLGVPFNYATEGFFQVNLPVYEKTLKDMSAWVLPKPKTLDLYSGVGSIGLTIGGDGVTLVEVNEAAVREMQRNIKLLNKKAVPVLAASENALEYISNDACVIVDPPRAGLHQNVVNRILEQLPPRVIYLSCNPVTQARDISLLLLNYEIVSHRGYNYFPRTPHTENLVVLDLKSK